MTNLEYLIQKENIKKLAMQLIDLEQGTSFDDETGTCITYYWYRTSDGREFGFPEVDDDLFKEAIEHEIEWLNSERQVEENEIN